MISESAGKITLPENQRPIMKYKNCIFFAMMALETEMDRMSPKVFLYSV